MDLESLERVRTQFLAELPALEEVAAAARTVLRNIAADAGVTCGVTVRTKDVASMLKKVVHKGYEDPWDQVTDKIGARIVVHRPSDVDRICAAIGADDRVAVLRTEDKRGHEPGHFDYSGVHVQTRIEAPSGASSEVEVQARTGPQDVWSDVSHTLLYKPIVEAPPEVRHAVVRLLALVELMDEEVERVVTQVELRPEYAARRLHRLAENLFLSFVAADHDEDLSISLLEALIPTIPAEDLPGYGARLGDFVNSRHVALAAMYADYGPSSNAASETAYMMFSQPEALVFFERLAAAPNATVASWQQLIPDLMLRTLVALSGADVHVP
jgi:ppGpp synthetase/RelA/SpoT-type nucleotidyltranferase